MESLKETRQSQGWNTVKHTSSHETDVTYTISNFVFDIAKFDPRSTHKNGKKILNMSYGEPTKANGYVIPEVFTEAVVDVVRAGDKNGYAYHAGPPEARQAIVDKYSRKGFEFQMDDVFFTFGCHGAL